MILARLDAGGIDLARFSSRKMETTHQMKFTSILVCSLVLCGLFGAAEAQAARTVYQVEMRDGVKLATDVYLSTRGDGPWPVILGRTPYGKSLSADIGSFSSSGYAVVIQDVRGRFASEGIARPWVDDGWGELQDGYDTVQWIRAQSWCNGKVVTVGPSAGSILQMLLAGAAPEGLVGQLWEVGPFSNYHQTCYFGGVFRKSLVEGWLSAGLWPSECLVEIRAHPTYDDYWCLQNLGERAEVVNWPIAFVGGWFDIFQQGTLDAFTTIQQRGGPNTRGDVHLLMGAWTHAVNNTQVGEQVFPDSAKKPSQWPSYEEWFACWLKDQPLRVDLPPVLYYTMGELPDKLDTPGNEWRSADTWPPESNLTSFYLTTEGGLRREPGQPGSFSYLYDPKNPVPTLGGQNLVLPMGSFDQRPIENRSDVLLFTTEPLAEPLEVTGRITAVLYVSTSTPDTDFTAKLTDVYPDGRSMLLNDGIRRLRFRNSLSNPESVTPGEIYRLEIDLWSTSMVFNAEHRIRVAISSSNSPRFEPNPNTGNPDWTSSDAVIAEQTIYVGGERSSHVLLPVVGETSGISQWERWGD